MIHIREASRPDASLIIDFQKMMAWETEKMQLNHELVTSGVNAVFDDSSKGRYFVAEDDGKVIASLLITYEWSDWRNCNVWWFQSVYVMPDYRRKGIFTKMYNYIKDLSGKLGIAGLRLYVETKNHTARKTYETLGMSPEHYSYYEWMRE